MTEHEKIAREIKDFLVDKNLTMTDVAARLGCSQQAVSNQLSGRKMGHRIAGHRTTAIYIKRDQRKVDEANRKVIDYIKESVPHLSTQDGLD